MKIFLILTFWYRVCSSDKTSPIFFLCLSKVWSIFCHWLVGRVHKKMLLNAFMYFFSIFFVVFHHKICVFIIFISFSDEISNLCNRTLSNQKLELVVSNQRNCINLLTFQTKSTFRIKILHSLQRKTIRFPCLNSFVKTAKKQRFLISEGIISQNLDLEYDTNAVPL